MMKERFRVPITKILLNDYAALLPALASVVFWIMYIVLLIGWDIPDSRKGGGGIQSKDAYIMLWIAMAVSIPGLILCLWRVIVVRKIIADGIVVKGEIVRVRAIRRRGLQTSAMVKFSYSYNGKEFLGSNWLLSWDSDKDQGDPLDLVLLPKRPGMAIIREIY
jgi:hypothetical protein